MLAEAVAALGNDITYITDRLPTFFEEFSAYPSHKHIKTHLTTNFKEGLPEPNFDVVFIVPGTHIKNYYANTISFAKLSNAHITLVNFESGDWFNELSPKPRALSDWAGWRQVAASASLILSSSKEGNRYAQKFYQTSATAEFSHCYPAINTPIADSVMAERQANRILMFARFKDGEHKGSGGINMLLDKSLKGSTFVLVVGSGKPPLFFESILKWRAWALGIKFKIKRRLTDKKKFLELKKASVLAFPSYFEGFGYPPVEALYCGTKTVAFNLPVLVETCGNHIILAKHGDWKDFKAKLSKSLRSDANTSSEVMKNMVTLEAMAVCLNKCLASLEQRSPSYQLEIDN